MADVDPLTERLRCPETQQPLRRLDADELDELNEAIRSGEVHTAGGDAVDQTVDGGLLREDERVVYPIRDDVPNLLPGDRISMPDS